MKKQALSAKDTFADQITDSSRLIQYYWKQLMSQTGMDISTRQWVALNRLYHNGEIFQKDFVNGIYDDRPTVTNMISSLEKKGLIIKEADSTDRRKYRIRLTHRGKRLYSKISDIVKKGRKKLYKGLTHNDYIELERILGTLKKNVLES